MENLSYNCYDLCEVISALKKSLHHKNVDSLFWAGELLQSNKLCTFYKILIKHILKEVYIVNPNSIFTIANCFLYALQIDISKKFYGFAHINPVVMEYAVRCIRFILDEKNDDMLYCLYLLEQSERDENYIEQLQNFLNKPTMENLRVGIRALNSAPLDAYNDIWELIFNNTPIAAKFYIVQLKQFATISMATHRRSLSCALYTNTLKHHSYKFHFPKLNLRDFILFRHYDESLFCRRKLIVTDDLFDSKTYRGVHVFDTKNNLLYAKEYIEKTYCYPFPSVWTQTEIEKSHGKGIDYMAKKSTPMQLYLENNKLTKKSSKLNDELRKFLLESELCYGHRNPCEVARFYRCREVPSVQK